MPGLRSQLERCTRVQALLGLCLALLLIGFYLLGYRPATAKLADLRMQIESRREVLDQNTLRTRALPDLKKSVRTAQEAVEKYDKRLPRQQEVDRFVKDIDSMVHTAGLQRYAMTPAVVPIRNGSFAEQPVKLSFVGDFLEVFSFLRQTEQMQRLTRVKELSLKSDERSGKPGQVEVELSMNIYFSEEQ